MMDNQLTFDIEGFEESESWREEWKNMPEYLQERMMPHDEVIVRFKSEEDKVAFFALINQDIPEKLQSIWYPKIVREEKQAMVYVDES